MLTLGIWGTAMDEKTINSEKAFARTLHVIIQCTAYTDCCSRVGNLILIVLTPKADNFYSSKRIDTCLGESALLLISTPKRNTLFQKSICKDSKDFSEVNTLQVFFPAKTDQCYFMYHFIGKTRWP